MQNTPTTFSDMGLAVSVVSALDAIGYETPSPIQAQAIPLLLEGRDLIGQAQTGTGKTAAFALPILSRLDLGQKLPQVLVLAPTRELAIQVAEAFKTYAAGLSGFHVLPVYGGQDYQTQIRALKRGVQVIVGTPGRVMDHIRRGTLKLDELRTLVLDEADEMLRMGFIDDVEWVMEQIPERRQIALFSATMPDRVRQIANTYLSDAEQITIKVKTTTAESIRQRFLLVRGVSKLDALTRILETEPFEGMLIFVRTKIATIELAEKLEARGYTAAALNGDIPQAQRERSIEQLKKGKLDILVATDVAARGLDVDRISHVINYDIPYDTEAYVHRIGRTGRAGREGDAILFVTGRERRMLGMIEKATRQKIAQMELPTSQLINAQRIERFKQRIVDAANSGGLDFYRKVLGEIQNEYAIDPLDTAAALARLLQGDKPFFLAQDDDRPSKPAASEKRQATRDRGNKPGKPRDSQMTGMQRYRLEVGHMHGVKPGNIVGAIANEAGIDSQFIGRIDIQEDHSLIDLPEGMPKAIFKDLKKTWVSGQRLNITKVGAKPGNEEWKSGKGSGKPAPAAGDKKRQRPAGKSLKRKNKRAGGNKH